VPRVPQDSLKFALPRPFRRLHDPNNTLTQNRWTTTPGAVVGVGEVVGVRVHHAALVGQGGLAAETVVGEGDVVVLRRVA